MAGKRVLVTGASGRIGQAAAAALRAAGHTVTGWDRRPGPEVDRIGELTSQGDVHAAARGQEVIVHLAATPDDPEYPPGDDDQFLTDLEPNNVVGLYHVLEAARRLRVPRVILASSGQVVWQAVQHGPWPLDANTPVTPRYWYACTKVLLEAAGQVYAREHGIEVLAVRLGWCPRTPAQRQQISQGELWQDVYLSPGDVGRFMVAAVAAPNLPGYHLVYATSRPLHQVRYELDSARRLLGFVPQDSWPTGADVHAS